MIIEAKPRPRAGPLEGNRPSGSRFEGIKNHREIVTVEKTCSKQQLKKTRFGIHKAGQPLGYCEKAPRGHPYKRQEKSGSEKWNSFLWSLGFRRFPSTPRGLPHEKTSSSSQYHPKKSLQVPRQLPYFTANANENNDNCPPAAYGGFAVNRNIANESTIPCGPDQICDFEIEDLTAEDSALEFSSSHSTTELSTSWRQRRKSFNTNPLSSTSSRGKGGSPPSLLHPRDLVRKNTSLQDHSLDNRQKTELSKPSIYQVLGIQPKNLSYAEGSSVQSSIKTRNTRINKAEFPTSIGRLVDFFESNSSNQLDFNNNEASLDSQNFNAECLRFEPQRVEVASKLTRSSPFRCLNSSSESQVKDVEFRRSSPSPIDFSSIFRNHSLDSGSGTRYSFPQTSGTQKQGGFSTGGIHNNNGNAVNTDSGFRPRVTGSHYDTKQFPSTSYLENRQRAGLPTTTSSHSVFFLPSERGRRTSSRPVSDVELINLESTRLPTWPRSLPSGFERYSHQSRNDSSSDTLIDLHITTEQTNFGKSWINNQEANTTREQKHSSDFIPYRANAAEAFQHCSGDKRRPLDIYQGSSFSTDKSKSQAASTVSVNNHHNATTSNNEFNFLHGLNPETDRQEVLFSENLDGARQEKQFPFGDFHFHHRLLNPLLRKKDNCAYSECNMGCIQSIAKSKVSPDRCHHGVLVEDIHAAIDRTPTEIEEKSPIVLRYRTPYFRASAHVIVPPIPRKETWTVGWIQACDSMKFINQYGNLGNSSWEIPALKDRRITAVSDSDGVSYPWYGNTTEIATVEGPTDTSRSLTLRMNDNFYPSVTWDIPVSEGSEAHLTHIVRDQSFTTWLAAVNQTTGRLEVLRTVKWHFYLEIEVDPSQELGKRAHIVSPLEQKQPIVMKNNTEPIYISSPRRSNHTGTTGQGGRHKRMNRRPGAGGDNNSNNHTNFIPKSALVRPSANNAQTLIWRPSGDVPVIVVPAKEEYKENNEIVWFTRTPTMHGHDHNVRILSMQEMSQLTKTID